MNFDDYQRAAMRTHRTPAFVYPGDKEPTPEAHNEAQALSQLLHASMLLCTESGELQDALKKHLVYRAPLDVTNLIEETGDILWTCALIAETLGTSLSEIAERNIAKLKARYPAMFTEHAALNRDLEAERRALLEVTTEETCVHGVRTNERCDYCMGDRVAHPDGFGGSDFGEFGDGEKK